MPITEYQREYDRRRHEEALPAYEALMSCYPFTLDDLDGEIWKDIDGYGKKKQRTIHSLVAQAFIPNPLKKPEVNHDDGHKLNCHISNLYWATTAENQQHAVKNGLAKSGEKHYKAKIKDEKDIIYIRENPDNLTQEELAEMFGVDQTTISAIQLGKCYQNAGGSLRESKRQRISDEIRERIRVDWATGTFSYAALGKKFGYCAQTIWNIVHEG